MEELYLTALSLRSTIIGIEEMQDSGLITG